MEVEIKIETGCKNPRIVIYTDEITQEISDIARNLTGKEHASLAGYKGEEIILIKPEEIIRIFTLGQKVMAQLEQETVQIRYRLYELENRLSGASFLRISNSEIINFNKVKSLDLSMGGSITLKLNTGDKSFVSRRYVDKIKKYLDLKK